MAGVAMVLWLPDPAEAKEVLPLVEASGHFDLLAVADGREDFVDKVRFHNPDSVLLSAPTGYDHAFEALILEATGGAPVTSIAIVPGDYAASAEDKRRAKDLRASSLSRSLVVRGDDAARTNIAYRLEGLAGRVTSRRRHTLDADELMDAMDAVVAASKRSDVSKAVVELAAWPVDLVLLLGDIAAISDLRVVLDKVFGAQMPVVVAIKGMSAEEIEASLEGSMGAKPKQLPPRGNLRELRGFFVSDWARLSLQGERFSSAGAAADSQQGPLASAAGLASGLVAVQMSRNGLDLPALERARASGCVLATLHPEDCALPTVAQSMIDSGIARAVFRASELAWYLDNAIPRRG